MNNQQYFDSNQKAWDLRTMVHLKSSMYDLEGWKKGGNSLKEVEIRELGDIAGKKVLHLQCHFGQDTLSLARMGAEVTGVDFSEKAIEAARELADEVNLPARFICCNVYDLPEHLDEAFDIVFCSYGVIGWLPDLEPWGKIVAKYVKPGGFFYIAEFHPVVWMLDEEFTFVKYPYHKTDPISTENEGTYADRDADIKYVDYGWNHSTAELLNSLIGAGLNLRFFNEYPFSPHDCFPKTILGDDGNFRIQGLENIIPMMFSLKAEK